MSEQKELLTEVPEETELLPEETPQKEQNLKLLIESESDCV